MSGITKRLAAVLAAALIGISAAEAAKVVVLRDRVCLRARPRPEVEVAGQVNTGAILESRGATGEWFEVVPPESVSLWVLGEYVKDGKVTTGKLNVRAGAGINYSVVGSLKKDDAPVVRGKQGEWLEIAPPANASLWVHRDFVNLVPAPRAPVLPAVAATPAAMIRPPVAAATSAVPVVAKAELPAGSTPVVESPAPNRPPDLDEQGLVPLNGQGEAMEREGLLRKTSIFDFGRVSNYCLVDRERGRPVTVCYIRGNNAQLKGFEGRRLKIKGEGYWIKGGAKPVIVPRQIMPLGDKPQ